MRIIAVFVFLCLSTISNAYSEEFNPIHILRPRSASRGHDLDCLSWRLAVETNNLQEWGLVPESCENYIGNYMMGKQYRHDCEAVAEAAIAYAKDLQIAGDGNDVWIFDIDETVLSNMPYFARSDVLFGALPYNDTKFNEWVAEGRAPAIPSVRRLYNVVLSLGIKPIILTGTAERYTEVRVANLKAAGYDKWEKLILKGASDKGTAVAFKSKRRSELVDGGFRIVGNIGDQWSDVIGPNAGNRTFKLPDPMYYIG